MTALPSSIERGCFMTQGLYLKANGELPCWDDVGESKILRKLDPLATSEGRELNISKFDALLHIRRSFAEGQFPHPGLCERCAVRSAGVPHREVDPTVLQVLHVEPSYMCHLSCPQCVPQKLRKSLKNPPYHLKPDVYRGFLAQLRTEGVSQIKLVIFEGRGDPLSCTDLEELVKLTKEYYPKSNTCITTHGSFPYKDWIAKSPIDMIRFSVDGARPESYARYRIGGKLELALGFMAGLRDDRKHNARLYVEWKYILFEWNDSDEELAEAAELARELNVQLRFCRTHTPGRSKKYETAQQVAAMIQRVAPRALQDLTFQLKEDEDFAQVDVVRGDQIKSLIRIAVDRAAADEEALACASLLEALTLDGGIESLPTVCDTINGLEQIVLDALPQISLSVTAEHLGGFFRGVDRREAVSSLLRRYIELQPDGPDRARLEVEAAVQNILIAYEQGDPERVEHEVRMLLGVSMTDNPLSVMSAAFSLHHTGLAAALANIFEQRGWIDAAILMFEQYLELAPDAPDHDRVSRHTDALRIERLLEKAMHQNRMGNHQYACSLAAQAVSAEAFAAGRQAPLLIAAIYGALTRRTIGILGQIAEEAGDFEAAFRAERRLRLDTALNDGAANRGVGV